MALLLLYFFKIFKKNISLESIPLARRIILFYYRCWDNIYTIFLHKLPGILPWCVQTLSFADHFKAKRFVILMYDPVLSKPSRYIVCGFPISLLLWICKWNKWMVLVEKDVEVGEDQPFWRRCPVLVIHLRGIKLDGEVDIKSACLVSSVSSV